MMKNIISFVFLFFCNITIFSQSITPKFGVEAGSSLKKIDYYSEFDSPALSGYIGIYTCIPFKTERFSAKFGAGLNLTPVHRNGRIIYPGGYEGQVDPEWMPEVNTVLSTLSVSAELRWYLLRGRPSWGNLYATLPFSFESKPFTDSWILRSGYRVMPGIGYRYEFNKHWNVEAGAGIGWGYLKHKYNPWNNETISIYSISLRIGYTF